MKTKEQIQEQMIKLLEEKVLLLDESLKASQEHNRELEGMMRLLNKIIDAK